MRASVLNFDLISVDGHEVGTRFTRNYAIGVAALLAVAIAVLATHTVRPSIVVGVFFGVLVLNFFGVGLFCFVLAYRRRAETTRGYRRVVGGLGVFFLVIGSLAIVAVLSPSATWPVMTIGCLLVARGVAFKIAGRVMKHRNADATN
jgi:hypothetical protein